METKNLTKSFGIRVPLDMYLKMIEVGAENKISITDICLYSLANSGILKSNFSFKIGGEVNTDHSETIRALITDIERLREQVAKSEKSKNQFRVAMEESDEEVERLKQEIQKLTDAKNTYHEAFSEGQEEIKKLKEFINNLKPKTQAERQKWEREEYKKEMERREREERK